MFIVQFENKKEKQMSDNPETQPFTVRVLSSELKDSAGFNQELKSIYGSTANNPKARTFMLGGLVGRTLLRDGETSLFDEVLEQATKPTEDAATVAEKRLDAVSRKVLATVSTKSTDLVGATGYELQILDDGSITDIHSVLYMNQSEARNNESQRISDQAPYGPKQNDSSFRVSK